MDDSQPSSEIQALDGLDLGTTASILPRLHCYTPIAYRHLPHSPRILADTDCLVQFTSLGALDRVGDRCRPGAADYLVIGRSHRSS